MNVHSHIPNFLDSKVDLVKATYQGNSRAGNLQDKLDIADSKLIGRTTWKQVTRAECNDRESIVLALNKAEREMSNAGTSYRFRYNALLQLRWENNLLQTQIETRMSERVKKPAFDLDWNPTTQEDWEGMYESLRLYFISLAGGSRAPEDNKKLRRMSFLWTSSAQNNPAGAAHATLLGVKVIWTEFDRVTCNKSENERNELWEEIISMSERKDGTFKGFELDHEWRSLIAAAVVDGLIDGSREVTLTERVEGIIRHLEKREPEQMREAEAEQSRLQTEKTTSKRPHPNQYTATNSHSSQSPNYSSGFKRTRFANQLAIEEKLGEELDMQPEEVETWMHDQYLEFLWTAAASARSTKGKLDCYSCGDEGHMSRDCRWAYKAAVGFHNLDWRKIAANENARRLLETIKNRPKSELGKKTPAQQALFEKKFEEAMALKGRGIALRLDGEPDEPLGPDYYAKPQNLRPNNNNNNYYQPKTNNALFMNSATNTREAVPVELSRLSNRDLVFTEVAVQNAYGPATMAIAQCDPGACCNVICKDFLERTIGETPKKGIHQVTPLVGNTTETLPYVLLNVSITYGSGGENINKTSKLAFLVMEGANVPFLIGGDGLKHLRCGTNSVTGTAFYVGEDGEPTKMKSKTIPYEQFKLIFKDKGSIENSLMLNMMGLSRKRKVDDEGFTNNTLDTTNSFTLEPNITETPSIEQLEEAIEVAYSDQTEGIEKEKLDEIKRRLQQIAVDLLLAKLQDIETADIEALANMIKKDNYNPDNIIDNANEIITSITDIRSQRMWINHHASEQREWSAEVMLKDYYDTEKEDKSRLKLMERSREEESYLQALERDDLSVDSDILSDERTADNDVVFWRNLFSNSNYMIQEKVINGAKEMGKNRLLSIARAYTYRKKDVKRSQSKELREFLIPRGEFGCVGASPESLDEFRRLYPEDELTKNINKLENNKYKQLKKLVLKELHRRRCTQETTPSTTLATLEAIVPMGRTKVSTEWRTWGEANEAMNARQRTHSETLKRIRSEARRNHERRQEEANAAFELLVTTTTQEEEVEATAEGNLSTPTQTLNRRERRRVAWQLPEETAKTGPTEKPMQAESSSQSPLVESPYVLRPRSTDKEQQTAQLLLKEGEQ